MYLPLSTVLLIGMFVLSCTQNLDAAATRFGFRTGRIAALSILLLLLSGFDCELGVGFSLHPAALLTLGLALFSVRGEKEAYSLPLSAFAGGVIGWLMARAFPEAVETGALLALPAALLARLLYRRPRAGLCLPLLSPLFYALCVMLEDWYLFGFASMGLGSPLQFDAQLCGALLYGALTIVPNVSFQKRLQKET